MIINPGDKIRIYGKEKKVISFYGCFNEGLKKWETIIVTEKRGDPFERSIDVIEIWDAENNCWVKADNYERIKNL